MNDTVVKNEVYKGIEYYIKRTEGTVNTWYTGYLVFNEDSKYYGKEYDEIDIPVHGGWTYSENELMPVIYPEDEVWIIGFDTAHVYDDETTQNVDFVEQELRKAIDNIKENK
jgi:hypothetical protein